MSTTVAEKPHAGRAAVPFMKTSTVLPSIKDWMRSDDGVPAPESGEIGLPRIVVL
jgi:hypothetical protein